MEVTWAAAHCGSDGGGSYREDFSTLCLFRHSVVYIGKTLYITFEHPRFEFSRLALTLFMNRFLLKHKQSILVKVMLSLCIYGMTYDISMLSFLNILNIKHFIQYSFHV